MTEAIQEQKKKEIFDFVYGLPEMAKKEGWVLRYDPESDEASITVPHLSDDARIHYVNDEIALYFSKGQIQGLFIEYFRKNFVQHQPNDLTALAEKINTPSEKEGFVEMTWNKVAKIAPDLEDSIKRALVKDAALSV